MSVESFNPKQTATEAINISVSPAAIKHFLGKLVENPAAEGLRLSVKPSGCSGYMYVIDYVDTANDQDARIDLNEQLPLYVDTASLPMINGTEIDYVKKGLNANIEFNNPNITGECGCGESFTVN